MQEKKKFHITRMLRFLGFIVAAAGIFIMLTYLFRNTSADRLRISGIKKQQDADVVFIGGSSTFTYWEPYRAWRDFGITSYLYCTNSLQMETVEQLVKEAERNGGHSLYVIDLRLFCNTSEALNEAALRNVTDSMSYSPNRFAAVYHALSNVNYTPENADYFSYWLEIAKYHTKSLGEEEQWKNVLNNQEPSYQGFLFLQRHAILMEWEEKQGDIYEDLTERSTKALSSLLEYLDKNKICAVFWVTPYYFVGNDGIYNTAEKMISEHGYGVVDFNEKYEEVGIDFEEDFYNGSHVNILGAEKCTNYMASYIAKHYDITDHRGDSTYENWEAESAEAFMEEKTTREWIEGELERKRASHEAGLELPSCEDTEEWLIASSNIDYLLIGRIDEAVEINERMKWMLEKAGIPLDAGAFLNSGGTIIGSGQEELSGETTIGNDQVLSYAVSGSEITLESTSAGAKKDPETYSLSDEHGKGIYVLVYDRNYYQVLDEVYFVPDEKGNLILQREAD